MRRSAGSPFEHFVPTTKQILHQVLPSQSIKPDRKGPTPIDGGRGGRKLLLEARMCLRHRQTRRPAARSSDAPPTMAFRPSAPALEVDTCEFERCATPRARSTAYRTLVPVREPPLHPHCVAPRNNYSRESASVCVLSACCAEAQAHPRGPHEPDEHSSALPRRGAPRAHSAPRIAASASAAITSTPYSCWSASASTDAAHRERNGGAPGARAGRRRGQGSRRRDARRCVYPATCSQLLTLGRRGRRGREPSVQPAPLRPAPRPAPTASQLSDGMLYYLSDRD